jgi:hypothetical protein
MCRYEIRKLMTFALLMSSLTAAPALAQTAVIDALSAFKAPFTVMDGAVAQVPDGRVFGFYTGGFHGAIYQIIPDGHGGYSNEVVYEFGDTESGGPVPYIINGGGAPVVVAAPDGSIYWAGASLSRFNPDTHLVEDLLPLPYQQSVTQLSLGIDGHTLFGSSFSGRIFSYDTTSGTSRDVTTLANNLVGVMQMKDGNLIAMTNPTGSPFDAVMHRIDPASGAETGAIVQDRSLGYPPARGDDGEIYAHVNVFGDRHFYRVDTSCFCLTDLFMTPYPSPWMSGFTGVRNGYLYYNNNYQPHRINLNANPPVLEHLANVPGSTGLYQILQDGTLVMFDFSNHVYALDTNTATPNGATPAPLIATGKDNDGTDGFPSEYTLGADGMLYGMSDNPRGELASIFRIDPNTRSRALVSRADVSAATRGGQYGAYSSKFLLGPDGRLFMALASDLNGMILAFDPATGATESLHDFAIDPATGLAGPDGAYPQRLALGADGWLYGVTSYDADYMGSTIFKIDPSTGAFVTIAHPTDPMRGFNMTGPMIEAAPGVWIGSYGKYDPDLPNLCGSLFRFDAATGSVAPLRDFNYPTDTCGPYSLVRAADGRVFGSGQYGGAEAINGNYDTAGAGAVFSLDATTGSVTTLAQFTYQTPIGGPSPDLLIGADGMLYSGYSQRIPNSYAYMKGLFRVDPGTGATDAIATIPTSTGYFGNTAVIFGSDGRLIAGVAAPYKVFAIGVDAMQVSPASGGFGGSTSLSATLKATGVPMPGRTITFSINGHAVGSATTNAQGVATLSNASVGGIAIGVFANAINASFAGDDRFPAATASSSLTVIDVPTPGLMTGNGFIRDDDNRYEFEFVVREKANGADRGGLSLSISQAPGPKPQARRGKTSDRFVSRSLTSVMFSDDPTIRPGRRPRPQVDTVSFAGPGEWNGRAGYRFEAFAQDRGEPGRHRESLRVTIFDSADHVVAAFDQDIDGGNIQSARMKH